MLLPATRKGKAVVDLTRTEAEVEQERVCDLDPGL